MNKISTVCILLLAILKIGALVNAQDIVFTNKIRRKTQSILNNAAPGEPETMKKSKGKGKGKGSSKKDYKKFEADIKSKDDDYDDLSGWVKVKKDDGKLKINYHIKEGPKECDSCKLAIYSGKDCKHIEDPYWDKDEIDKNPWSVGKGAKYITNSKGRAAAFIKVKNGKPINKHECKLVVLFDKDKDDDDDDDDDHHHKHDDDDDDDDHHHHKHDDDDDDRRRFLHSKPKGLIGCGVLIPENKPSDFCD